MTIRKTYKQLIVFFVRCWQATRIFRSYFFQCRFYPSCSDYFLDAIKLYGLFTGVGLTIKRLIKCHPLCEGGIDEVYSLETSEGLSLCDKPERRKGLAQKSEAIS